MLFFGDAEDFFLLAAVSFSAGKSPCERNGNPLPCARLCLPFSETEISSLFRKSSEILCPFFGRFSGNYR